MNSLDEAIKATVENKKIRPILGDDISIHVSRLILSSVIDIGSAGQGFLFHAGKHLGAALVTSELIRGNSIETVLNSVIEELMRLRLGIYSIRNVTDDSAIIESKECYFCSGMHSPDNIGICHYDRGLLCGALAKALNREFSIVEAKCHSLGHHVCEFEVRGT